MCVYLITHTHTHTFYSRVHLLESVPSSLPKLLNSVKWGQHKDVAVVGVNRFSTYLYFIYWSLPAVRVHNGGVAPSTPWGSFRVAWLCLPGSQCPCVRCQVSAGYVVSIRTLIATQRLGILVVNGSFFMLQAANSDKSHSNPNTNPSLYNHLSITQSLQSLLILLLANEEVHSCNHSQAMYPGNHSPAMYPS